MEQKTMKVLDVCESGCWLICVKDCTGKMNPYRLYRKYYEPGKGYRRKMVAKYADFISVICAIRSIFTAIDALSR